RLRAQTRADRRLGPRLRSGVRKPRAAIERHRAGGNDPGQDLELELAGTDSGVLLGERPCLVETGPEEVQSPEPAARRTRKRSRSQELAALVQRRQVVEVRVLQRVGR